MSHGGPTLFRCVRCGCPATDHATDDEERRECSRCECEQYECSVTPPEPSALTRAVEAWREVPEAQRAAALAVIEKEASIAAGFPSMRGLVAHALDRAADLLRAAGGEP